MHLFLGLVGALDHSFKGREGQEAEEDAVYNDDDRSGDEDGVEGQVPCGHKADGKGEQELCDGDGQLGEDVGDGALFLEDLHAGGGDAGVQEGVCHTADDGQDVTDIHIRCKSDGQQEDGVEDAADQSGQAAAETVGQGTCDGEGHQTAQADGGDDGHDAGYVKAAVCQLAGAPQGGEVLLVLPHDGCCDAQDKVGDVQG